MQKHRVILAVAALVLASLACQTVMGGGGSGAPDFPPNDGGGMEVPTVPPAATDDGGLDVEIPTIPPIATDESGNLSVGGETDFPVPDDATNMVNMGNDLVTFQTKLSLDEVMKFYKDQFGKLGYTEKEAETFTTNSMFSITFDDSTNSRLVSVQAVDMDGTTSVTIMASKK